MSLSDEQWEFSKDLARLLLFIDSIGQKATLGEVERTKEQQEIHVANGVSWTMDSKHLDKLAGDLNIWIDGVYLGSLPAEEAAILAEPIGAYWEILNPKNVWGGRWEGKKKDVPHVQRGR